MRTLLMLITVLATACGTTNTSPDASTSPDAFTAPDASTCGPSGASCEAGEDCCSGGCGVATLTCG